MLCTSMVVQASACTNLEPQTEGLSKKVPVRSRTHIVSGLTVPLVALNHRSWHVFGVMLSQSAPAGDFSTPLSSPASPIARDVFEIQPFEDAPEPASRRHWTPGKTYKLHFAAATLANKKYETLRITNSN